MTRTSRQRGQTIALLGGLAYAISAALALAGLALLGSALEGGGEAPLPGPVSFVLRELPSFLLVLGTLWFVVAGGMVVAGGIGLARPSR